MPLVGNKPVHTLMFIIDCKEIQIATPWHINEEKGSSFSSAFFEMLKIVKFNFNIKKQSIKTPKNPNSSAMIARIKSVWASGRYSCFCILWPSPTPKKPPLPKANSECTSW